MIKFPMILAMTLEQNSLFDLWARLILLHPVFLGAQTVNSRSHHNYTQFNPLLQVILFV